MIQTLFGKMGNMTWNNQHLQFPYGPTDKTVDFKLTIRKKFFSGESQTIGGFQERFGELIYNHELQNGGIFKSEGNMRMKNMSSEICGKREYWTPVSSRCHITSGTSWYRSRYKYAV